MNTDGVAVPLLIHRFRYGYVRALDDLLDIAAIGQVHLLGLDRRRVECDLAIRPHQEDRVEGLWYGNRLLGKISSVHLGAAPALGRVGGRATAGPAHDL